LIRTIAIAWVLAFTAAAIAGFLYSRYELKTAYHDVSRAILLGISQEVIGDKVILALSCSGTDILFRYEVGSEKPLPDRATIAKWTVLSMAFWR
jgi:hypothetical protein